MLVEWLARDGAEGYTSPRALEGGLGERLPRRKQPQQAPSAQGKEASDEITAWGHLLALGGMPRSTPMSVYDCGV